MNVLIDQKGYIFAIAGAGAGAGLN